MPSEMLEMIQRSLLDVSESLVLGAQSHTQYIALILRRCIMYIAEDYLPMGAW